MARIPVGLVGITGYTGMELARILVNHPDFELIKATSRTEAGKRLVEFYPFVQNTRLENVVLCLPEAKELAGCELVFLAVPHGAAMDMAAELLAAGLKVVDLSADFRLRDPSVYAAWYGQAHRHPHLIAEAAYGLPERYEQDIKAARLVANPGCYPTSVFLGLWPALAEGLIDPSSVVADSKSGASGAGRGASVASLFSEVHDSFRPYNLAKHRHTPEMEQELSAVAGCPMTITFSPHLVPLQRGILSTLYAKLKNPMEQQDVQAIYEKHYQGRPWVRVLPAGKLPETRHVRGSMYADLGVVVDSRTGRLIVASAIDNMCRGASGQAVACANLMSGLPVDAGLNLAPLMP
ncbi:N-acetyl-gamma-glutamyl-phosphate reductase [Fundidesulfovibrio butyratiphilus]